MTRRHSMGLTAAAMTAAVAGALRATPAGAQQAGEAGAEPAQGTPFTFEELTRKMRQSSRQNYKAPEPAEGALADLDFDEYRLIQFNTKRARWKAADAGFELHAYPLGWLFDEPVEINEIVDGVARPMTFTTADFNYYGDLAKRVPKEETALPGVAGFRLNAPLNAPDRFDEVVSFLGASYFRALGRGNVYGLSARGLAVNTATSAEEEFPRFTAFWLERPEAGAERIVLYAALDSPSVTGAYRFVIEPGADTRIEVTARLFFRAAVRQLGVAPLTSMYLFGPNDRGTFDDYRERVHDSELLMLDSDRERFIRPLNNPPRLANSYLAASGPTAFGLLQRHKAFEDYLDGGAHYERRPSLVVEPLGDWGPGSVRLIEIPSDLETNDNIVAFWVPAGDVTAGDELEFRYRLHWGDVPGQEATEIAQILRTLAGHGGVSGVKPAENREKFVIDFAGGMLPELEPDTDIKPRIDVNGGELAETVLHRIDGTDTWRLVIEVSAEPGAVVEMKARLFVEDRPLSETWLYQWMKE